MMEVTSQRHELLERISQSEHSEVYRARDRVSQSTIAVKLARSPVAPASDYLRREYQCLSNLRHPGIVRVRDLGFDELRRPFFTMDYVQGRTLESLDKQEDAGRALLLVPDICRALYRVHRAGIVHSDLNPSNILIDHAGSTPRAVLLDFGLASRLGERRLSFLTGVERYISPEVRRGEALTPASDIYSFGVMLQELLSTLSHSVAGRRNEESSARWAEIAGVCASEDPANRPMSFEKILSDWLAVQAVDSGTQKRLKSPIGRGTRLFGFADAYKELRSTCDEKLKAGGGLVRLIGVQGTGKSSMSERHRHFAQLRGAATIRIDCDHKPTDAAHVFPFLNEWVNVFEGDSAGSRERFVYLNDLDPSNEHRSFLDDLERFGRRQRLVIVLTQRPDPYSRGRREKGTVVKLGSVGKKSFNRVVREVFEDDPFVASYANFLYAATGGIPGRLVRKYEEWADFMRSRGIASENEHWNAPSVWLNDGRNTLDSLPPAGKVVAWGVASVVGRFTPKDIAALTGLTRESALTWLIHLAALGIIREVRIRPSRIFAVDSIWADDALRLFRHRFQAENPSRKFRVRSFRQRGPSSFIRDSVQSTLTYDLSRLDIYRSHGQLILPELVKTAKAMMGAQGLPPDRTIDFAELVEFLIQLYVDRGYRNRAEAWSRRFSQYVLQRESRGEGLPDRVIEVVLDTLRLLHSREYRAEWIRQYKAVSSTASDVVQGLIVGEEGHLVSTAETSDKARFLYAQAEELFQRAGKSDHLLAKNKLRIGILLQRVKDYKRAIDRFKETMELADKAGDSLTKNKAAYNTAIVVMEMGQPERARRILFRTDFSAIERSDRRTLARILLSRTVCNSEFEPAQEVLELARQALDGVIRSRDTSSLPTAYSNVGWILLRLGRVEAARQNLARALNEAILSKNDRGAALASLNLARLGLVLGDWQYAKRYAETSLRHAKESKSETDTEDALREIAQVQLAQGDIEGANASLKRVEQIGALSENRHNDFLRDMLAVRLSCVLGDTESAGWTLQKWLIQLQDQELPDGWKCIAKLHEGEYLIAKGDGERAFECLRKSAHLARRLERVDLLLRIYQKLIDASVLSGRRENLAPYIVELVRLRKRVGVMKDDDQLNELVEDLLKPKGEGRVASVILDLSQSLRRFQDKRQLLEELLRTAVQYSGADCGALISRHPISERFFVEAELGLDSTLARNDAMELSRTVVRKTTLSADALVIEDAKTHRTTRGKRSIVELNIEAVLCVPIMIESQCWGVLYLDNRAVPRAFTNVDLGLVKAIANFMALAIEQADNVKRLELGVGDAAEDFDSDSRFIATSRAMKMIHQMIKKVADSDAPILLLGEHGTGKDVVARLIKKLSGRREGPFVEVNAPGLTEELSMADLFGIEANTATGVAFREGKFKLADGGTLLLNEVGDIHLNVQPKLLTALEAGYIQRVGSNEEVPVDVRLIAATNRNLDQMMSQGIFREDLYYRINAIKITLPPLRERSEDILPMAELFLEQFKKRYACPTLRFTAQHQRELRSYSWPGNVRELKSLLHRSVLLSNDGKLPNSLLSTPQVTGRNAKGKEGLALRQAIHRTEEELIRSALERTGWNQRMAARELGLSESGLRAKIRKLKVNRSRIS